MTSVNAALTLELPHAPLRGARGAPRECEQAMSGMGQSPKVIRVSFGAFSCILEGFEDPVEPLFAVTEHFRTLVAQDPGFAGGMVVPNRAALEPALAGAGVGELRVRWGPRPELVVEVSGEAGSRDPRGLAPKDEGRSVLGRLEDALRALPWTLAGGPFAPARTGEPSQGAGDRGGELPLAGPAPFAAAGGGAQAEGLSGAEARDLPQRDAAWAEDDAHWPGDGEDWAEGR